MKLYCWLIWCECEISTLSGRDHWRRPLPTPSTRAEFWEKPPTSKPWQLCVGKVSSPFKRTSLSFFFFFLNQDGEQNALCMQNKSISLATNLALYIDNIKSVKWHDDLKKKKKRYSLGSHIVKWFHCVKEVEKCNITFFWEEIIGKNWRLTSRLNKYQGSSCFSWNVQKALVDFLQRTLQMQKSKSTSGKRGEGGLTEKYISLLE